VKYVLKLFITGKGSESIEAFRNIKRICEQHLAGRHQLWVVDVLEQPGHAQDAEIAVTPTLLKEQPPPPRSMTGDLSDETNVLTMLGLHGGSDQSS